MALDELSNELLSPAEVVEVVDSSLIDLTARRFRSSLSLAFSASNFTDSCRNRSCSASNFLLSRLT